jgi:hypothetical protein
VRGLIRYWMLLLAMVVGGCSAGAASRAVVDIGVADGPLWLAPEETDYYQCNIGLLICHAAVGRRSKRLCQCVNQ